MNQDSTTTPKTTPLIVSHRLAEVPPLYHGLFKRVYARRAPRSGGIKAFCLECVGFIREDITTCTAVACPLYHFRPYQKP